MEIKNESCCFVISINDVDYMWCSIIKVQKDLPVLLGMDIQLLFYHKLTYNIPLALRREGYFGQRQRIQPNIPYVAVLPRIFSISNSRLYLASLSPRQGAPVLICPAFNATARSAMKESLVSPLLWLIMAL